MATARVFEQRLRRFLRWRVFRAGAPIVELSFWRPSRPGFGWCLRALGGLRRREMLERFTDQARRVIVLAQE